MNSHADTAGRSAHRAAWDVLPWLLNGSLDGAERDAVQAHIRGCALCRDELAQLRALRCAGLSSPDSAHDVACDPERGLARILPRLDAPRPAPSRSGAAPGLLLRWRERLAANQSSWLRTALVAQGALIAALLVALVRPGDAGDGPYRVLGASGQPQARLVVVFRPDTTERELRRIVRGSGVRIVDGPTTTDAYLVGADGDAGAALARLRAEPAVTLAEPLDPKGRP